MSSPLDPRMPVGGGSGAGLAGTDLDLPGLRARVQAELDEVLGRERGQLASVAAELAPLVDAVSDLVSGGKRLRPAFCYWGWRGAGGAAHDDGLPVRVGASLELFQAAALLHDDVMDRSDTRRGRPAMHRAFAGLHAQRGWAGDGAQFGDAAAILAGDLCLSWSDDVFATAVAAAGAERARAASEVFVRMRTLVMAGQYLDVLAQASGGTEVDEAAATPGGDVPGAEGPGGDGQEPPGARGSGQAPSGGSASGAPGPGGLGPVDVSLRVIRYKSATYTVEHPLLIGAALAGAGPGLADAYHRYGLSVGEAYQLRDDVLGVFGDPSQTGKPAGDDLREGKRTVLVALALAGASPTGRDVLLGALGRDDLDDAGVAAVREVLVDSGALARTESMIDERVRAAREVVADAPVDPVAREVLVELAGTATARTA